jgi:hypothetical protein
MIRNRWLIPLLLLIPATAAAQTSESNSKQVFQEAARAPAGSARAVELYRRYTQLEPDDAWGHLALAEAYAAAQRFSDAQASVQRAEQLVPGEGDVAIVRARINRAQRTFLPSVKPNALASRDSDGNASTSLGVLGDVSVGRTTRFGLTGSHTITSAEQIDATMNRGAVLLTIRTPTVRWTSEVGGAQITHDSSYTLPVGQTHLRWAASPKAPVIDVRVRRAPVTAAYSLIHAEALLTEARGLFDVPVASRLKLRASGQLGSLQDRVDPLAPLPTTNRGRGRRNTSVPYTETNRRVGYGGALVTPISTTSEVALNAYRLTYEHAGSGNYFAPEFADLLEVSSYSEIYRFDPLTIAFDAGLGVQRAKLFGEATGDVTPAARLWAQLSWALSPYLELAGEVDAYKSQLSTVATSSSWNSVSGGVSVRWLIR